jgi:hypothetical protein
VGSKPSGCAISGRSDPIGLQLKVEGKSRATTVKTPDGVVIVDLPDHIPVAAEEIALLRAFLAEEINGILWPTVRSAPDPNATPSADNQLTDHLVIAVATDGSNQGVQSCR